MISNAQRIRTIENCTRKCDLRDTPPVDDIVAAAIRVVRLERKAFFSRKCSRAKLHLKRAVEDLEEWSRKRRQNSQPQAGSGVKMRDG